MIGILIDNITKNAWETYAIEQECKLRELPYKLINIYKILMESNRTKPDCEVAIARLMMGTGFRLQALKYFHDLGVKVVNSPSSIEIGNNKFETATIMEQNGIPHLRTILLPNFEMAVRGIADVGTPTVIKPLAGTYGRGIERIRNLETQLGDLESEPYPLIAQKYLETGGVDYRVWVADGEVLGVMKRTAPKGEWKTNISLGAASERVELPEVAIQMSIDATKAIGATFSGIDLVQDVNEEGPFMVLEINTQPDFKGFYSCTGINPAKYIVDYAVKLQEKPLLIH